MYRLNLITHLQREEVPLKSTACIRDMVIMLEAATLDDIYSAYNNMRVDDDHIITCIGTSGPHPLPNSNGLGEVWSVGVELRIAEALGKSLK